MGRLSVFIALALLLGSAIYAYSIKYDTIVLGEQIARQKIKIQKEKDQIALLKAEWQFLNRPDRIQALSDLQADMAAMQTQQIVRWSDIPMHNGQLAQPSLPMESLPNDITSSTVAGPRKHAATKRTEAEKGVPMRPEDMPGGGR
jgi:hypothetical protein